MAIQDGWACDMCEETGKVTITRVHLDGTRTKGEIACPTYRGTGWATNESAVARDKNRNEIISAGEVIRADQSDTGSPDLMSDPEHRGRLEEALEEIEWERRYRKRSIS